MKRLICVDNSGTRPKATDRVTRIVRALVLMSFSLLLIACTDGVATRDSHVQLVTATHRPSGTAFITTAQDTPVKFFSRENLRATYFSGDIDPKVNKPAGPDQTGFMNFAGLNGPGRNGANSEFQIEIESDDIFVEPIRKQQIIGGQWQNQNSGGRAVSLNYEDEPIDQVVQDVFGGILGVNYILGESVEGNITFRSEKRFSQAELIQIMADILARNGYLIQFFNSVYHIGLPDELDELTGLRGRTALETDERYVITLRSAAPENIAEIASALIPPGNTVTAVPDSRNLVVRGDPSQFKSIEDLVMSLAGDGSQQNFLAILPLRRSSPELIADQLTATYEARNLGDVVFLPLEQRQGVLVMAQSQKAINQARSLTQGLDVDSRDKAKLRVIQLTYLNAQDTAQQLQSVFGAEASSTPVGPQGGESRSNIVRAAVDLANAGENAGASAGEEASDSNEGGANIPVPRFLRRIVSGDEASADAGTPAGRGANAARTESQPGVSIAADVRNNSLLVRSSYAEFKRISAAVKTLDVPLAQVVIEATIVEVLINDSLQYGVQTFLQSNTNTLRSAPVRGASDGGGAGFVSVLNSALGGRNIQAVLTALQSVSDVKVISSPYLTVTDGATSRLAVGDQIPFVTASQTSNSNGQVTVTQEVDARDIGVILEVTPKIAPDNSVVLDVLQEVSSAANETTIAGDNPTISQRSVQSQITVNSGSTVLLGGLIQERSDVSVTGVPVLSKIPVVGEAFKQTSNNQRRSELLVLITPRVVRNSSQVQDVTNQLKWLLTTR